MLKNQQQVSAGRATPAPSRDMLRDFQGDVNMTQGNIDRELGDSSDLETLQRMRRYQGMAAGGEAVPNKLKGFSFYLQDRVCVPCIFNWTSFRF